MKLAALAALLAALLPFQANAPSAAPAPPSTLPESVSGLVELGEGALAYVPAGALNEPAPLLVLLHGAGGQANGMIERFRRVAEAEGLVLLAPQSAGRTWDLILAASASRGSGTFRFSGGDSDRIERAMDRLSDRTSLDSDRVTLAGFSDGASYALSLGPTRPGLYRSILAFSPGFTARAAGAAGRQPIFIAHGRRDNILPFARSRDIVVPQLRSAGHSVTFHPFDGGHSIGEEAITQAIRFLDEGPQVRAITAVPERTRHMKQLGLARWTEPAEESNGQK